MRSERQRQMTSGATGMLFVAVALVFGSAPGLRASEPAPAAKPPAASPSAVKADGSARARAAVAAIAADTSFVSPEALRLRIASHGKLLTLTGSAATLYDREQAARRAESVAGAAGIRPAVTIKPETALEPSALEGAVKQAVQAANVMGPTFGVRASADGTVQLSGEVTDEWRAVNAVKKVPGVTAIGGYEARRPGATPPAATGQLTIVTPSTDHDNVTKTNVETALREAGIDKVAVSVTQGRVKLTGRPGSYVQALVASRTASMVAGAIGVDNQVTVPGRAYRVGEVHNAAEMQQNVRRELRRLSGKTGYGRITDLGVHVSRGSVFLTGRVSSESAAYAAIDAAASVTGVEEVVNALSYPTNVAGS